MKKGILGAMPEEVAPILEVIKDYETATYGKNNYYLGSLNGCDVVVAYSKIGKVNSTITAMSMCEHFGVTAILFSGVAGSLSQNLKIGDIVLANRCAQYDLDITIFGHPLGYVPEGAIFTENDKQLRELAKKVAKESSIELSEGVVVTGDKFMSSLNEKSKIAKHFNAIAIEMEGASVALTCSSLGIPCLIIRTISDNADDGAGNDFDTFVEESSAISAKLICDIVSAYIRT